MLHKLISICLIIALTSCRKNMENVNSNKLNLSLSTHLDSVDPARSYDGASSKVVYNTYEQLYQYHYLKRPLEVIPLLAVEMPKYDESRKVVTIKIKKNIRVFFNYDIILKFYFVKPNEFFNAVYFWFIYLLII